MLTVIELKSLINDKEPTEKVCRISIEKGLYLEVHPKEKRELEQNPKAGKYWRWKYRFAGKEKRLSIGTYSDLTLKNARKIRDDAKLLVNE